MVNGIPGRMGISVAETVAKRFGAEGLLPFSLTGENVEDSNIVIGGKEVRLVKPSERESAWKDIQEEVENSGRQLIAVDYTHPDAALGNAKFYAGKVLPFVMGTTFHTQEDSDALRATVLGAVGVGASAGMDGGGGETLDECLMAVDSGIGMDGGKKCNTDRLYAVVAPNMGKPIVVLQAMVEAAAQQFENALDGYSLRVVESHQKGKADTSGTAKAVVGALSGLGVHGKSTSTLGTEALIQEIEMLRDESEQLAYGVPAAHVKGHAYHRYEMVSPDGTVQLALEHNVCGRSVYAEGTVDAVEFLARVINEGHNRRFWSMLDLLKENAIR
eukprot:g2903.t1